ncbi:putative 4-coumarate-CoA ligase [Cryomyces antarcticus]
MPIKSRWTIPIPQVSLPTSLFTSPTEPLPTTPILIDAERPDEYSLSLSTYRLWSQRLAAGLQHAGLKPGDRVLLFSGNTLFFPVVLLGVIMAGGIFTGANPTYVARELAYQLKDSGALFLITVEGSLDTAMEATESIGMSKDRVFVFDDGRATFDRKAQGRGETRHWTHLLASEEEGRDFKWEELSTDEELNQTIALNYSSGTTGVPKGVEITHRNYVANTAQYTHMSSLLPDADETRKRARWLCFLPMYHAMAQTIFCVVGPVRGIPVYLMPKFDFLKMLEKVQKYRITDLTLVPPVVVALAKHPATKKYDLSSVERVGSGAAPLGREVCAEVETLWPAGKINVKQGWGMTEATCSVCGWDPNEISESFSVGELNANCEAQIMTDDGLTEVPQGERGELWVRAPNIMKGYWNKPEATKETLTEDGWLKTGDVAYVDKYGKFFIVDRKKELIKVKGIQVAPAELEALLLDHPAIADAAVIGVTIKGEELPRAYLVQKEGENTSADEIQEFMKKRVSRTKWLAGGIRFVDTVPKNPSGKILRKLLREQAKAEVGDSEARAARL